MSDNSSKSVFAKYRIYVFATIGVLLILSTVAVAMVKNWIPNLFAVFGNWLVLTVLAVGVTAVGVMYLYYTYSGGTRRDWPWGTSPEEQLSKEEARALTEWALFNESPPIKVGQYERKSAKPETSQDSGNSTRVYDAIFQERHSSTYHGVVVNLEDGVEFEINWLENRTKEKLHKADRAVQQLNDWETLEQRDGESLETFEERVEEARKQLGQSRRTQKRVEHYDEGELDRVETIDISSVRSQEEVEE